jgi:hypothetical protein
LWNWQSNIVQYAVEVRSGSEYQTVIRYGMIQFFTVVQDKDGAGFGPLALLKNLTGEHHPDSEEGYMLITVTTTDAKKTLLEVIHCN